MRILRVVGVVVLVLALLAWGASAYLLGREDVPEQSDFRIDLPELRRLAGSLPGALPLRVNHERLAVASLPRAAVFAGEPFEPHEMVHGAYQVIYPDGSFAVIDAGMSKALFEEQMAGPGDDFSAEARGKIDRALEGARVAVVTHEHDDHIDGLAQHPAPERIKSRVRLNEAQRAYETLPAVLRDGSEPLVYAETLALAPGLVLLRAAGHTPGSQVVFVKLENGEEWLFLGDVAWHMDQIRELHYRPRLVTDWILGEDRSAVLAQFRALHELENTESARLVASHDLQQHDALLQQGHLGDGFE